MENKQKTQNEGFGEDDGARKMVSTPVYASLRKQRIDVLSESIELRKQNIETLSKEDKKEELKNEEPEIVLA